MNRVAPGVFMLPSETVEGRLHKVQRKGKGFTCSCHQFRIRGEGRCKHTDSVKQRFEKRPYKKVIEHGT